MSIVARPEYEEPLQEICDLYNEAEADIKITSRDGDILIGASVNQLRYAGQHLARALVATDESSVVSNLDAAKRHAQRAIYDVNDAAMHIYLTEIRSIQNDYPVNINAIVPDYSGISDAVFQAEELIETLSLDHQRPRELMYQDLRDVVATLRDASKRLNMHRPAILAAVARENVIRNRTWLAIAVSMIVAGLSILRLTTGG